MKFLLDLLFYVAVITALLWLMASDFIVFPVLKSDRSFIKPFRSPLFSLRLLRERAKRRLTGRALAINTLLTPHETSRGSQRMDADAGVVTSSYNAVVKLGSDDRHFTLPSAAADIPLGVILNDEVDANEQGRVSKNIALFGLYPESLAATTTQAIAAGTDLVVDPANPGNVIPIPTAAGSGTFYTMGRCRYTVPAGGGPVSIIHCVPRKIVV